MKTIPKAMKAYLETHPFDSGSDDCDTVLDQLYLAYANSHESDPPEIRKGFEELEGDYLHTVVYDGFDAGHADVLNDTQVGEVFLTESHPEACTLDGGVVLDQ